MRKNKKGISAIVATVLIILITIAAVAIVWTAILPIFRGQIEGGTICFDATSQLLIMDSGYTCYDSAANTIDIQLKMGSKDIDLADVQVLVSEGGNTASFNLSGAAVPGANEERVYTIDISSSGFTSLDSVQIAPIVNIGNSKKTCDVSGSIDIKAC